MGLTNICAGEVYMLVEAWPEEKSPWDIELAGGDMLVMGI